MRFAVMNGGCGGQSAVMVVVVMIPTKCRMSVGLQVSGDW